MTTTATLAFPVSSSHRPALCRDESPMLEFGRRRRRGIERDAWSPRPLQRAVRLDRGNGGVVRCPNHVRVLMDETEMAAPIADGGVLAERG